MKLSFRFIIPLILVLSALAYLTVPISEKLIETWAKRDVDIRSRLIASSISDSIIDFYQNKNISKINNIFAKLVKDERLVGVGLCENNETLSIKTDGFPKFVTCKINKNELSRIVNQENNPLHISYNSIDENLNMGYLVLIHDMGYVVKRSETARKYIFYFFLGLGFIISTITVLIAYFSWWGLISGIKQIIKRGGIDFSANDNTKYSNDLIPIVKEVKRLIKDLESDKYSKEANQISWSPETLKEILHKELRGDEVITVSNREPYIHVKNNNKIEVKKPASGVVTALEPIMRACSGVWVAHGSGNADKLVVDKNDHIDVPPDHPSYKLRRVWLTEEEENGYYYGFANEGMWPLCHVAHARPTFRSDDWKQYVNVNKKFAKTIVEEAKTKDPVVLIQDYHFALLPKMIKELLPDATIIMFWHIPWPNSETFGICPWREEILEGLLGSTILGFHTRYHCNNFLETVDRNLESRINRESSTVSYNKEITAVKPYPISISSIENEHLASLNTQTLQKNILGELYVSDSIKVGIGVDRLDYTKGIPERFMAIDRFLELHPEWIGKFTFIQIAAPTRSIIQRYKQLDIEVRELAAKINNKYKTAKIPPIILKIEHHGPESVYEHYKAANLCIVSSLHDGMNLVAKEFIISKDDEQGVLILSQFTGASSELPEALIINPYDIDQSAGAIHKALIMPEENQKERMRSMRANVKEFNVYRWAGRMLLDAALVRHRNRILKTSNQQID